MFAIELPQNFKSIARRVTQGEKALISCPKNEDLVNLVVITEAEYIQLEELRKTNASEGLKKSISGISFRTPSTSREYLSAAIILSASSSPAIISVIAGVAEMIRLISGEPAPFMASGTEIAFSAQPKSRRNKNIAVILLHFVLFITWSISSLLFFTFLLFVWFVALVWFVFIKLIIRNMSS